MSNSNTLFYQNQSCISETFNCEKSILKSVSFKMPDEYTVPDGVEEIGEKAFFKCENLKKINLPIGLRVIGKKAFEGCKNLETLIIPETVSKIDARAFFGCKSLKK